MDAAVTNSLDAATVWIEKQIRVALETALGEDRIISRADSWRSCMADQGWAIPDWRLPGGLKSPGVGLLPEEESEAWAAERANVGMAVDDVHCQEEVDWLSTLRSVEGELQQETVERVPEIFAEVRELLDTYAARLAQLRLENLG